MSAFCTACGAAAGPGDRFCADCGAPLRRVDSPTVASNDPVEVVVEPVIEPAREPDAETTPIRTGLAAVGLIGAIGVVAGTALPWARTFAGGHAITESGLDRHQVVAGILGLVALISTGLHLSGLTYSLAGTTRPPRRIDRVAFLGVAVVTLGYLGFVTADVIHDVDAARAANGEAMFGSGIPVAFIGAALMLIAGALEASTDAHFGARYPSWTRWAGPTVVIGVGVLLAVGVVADNADRAAGPDAKTLARAQHQLDTLVALAAEPVSAEVRSATDWQQRFNAILAAVEADPPTKRAFVRLLGGGESRGTAIGAVIRLAADTSGSSDTTDLSRALDATSRFGWFWKKVDDLIDWGGKEAVKPLIRALQDLASHVGVGTAVAADPESPAAAAAARAANQGNPLPAAGLVNPKIFPVDPALPSAQCSAGAVVDSLGRCVPIWEGTWSGRFQGTSTGPPAEGARKTCNISGPVTVTITHDDGARADVTVVVGGASGQYDYATCSFRSSANATFSSTVGHDARSLHFDDGAFRFEMTKAAPNFADGSASGGQGVATAVKVTLARAG